MEYPPFLSIDIIKRYGIMSTTICIADGAIGSIGFTFHEKCIRIKTDWDK